MMTNESFLIDYFFLGSEHCGSFEVVIFSATPMDAFSGFLNLVIMSVSVDR